MGEDFLDVIERYLAEIDVMLVLIGQRWVDAADAEGRRRLEAEDDLVAIEVGRALERGCRVSRWSTRPRCRAPRRFRPADRAPGGTPWT